MIKLSNTKLISILTKLLILLVIAKAISLTILWYLPSDGVELNVKENYQPKYQRVSFRSMIIPKVIEVVEVKEVDTGTNITDMILKGLYGTQTKGFVIVAMKSTPNKTSIVGVGEDFEGYILKAIFIHSAKFNKDGTDFILNLKNAEHSSTITKVGKKTSQKDSRVAIDTPALVSRNDIKYYAKNPKQIWKDISIHEVKEGKRIIGFKVTKIKPKSRFARLGLQKGDLIVKANNVKLQSYREALQIYKNINKLDTIQIVVMRNNMEVELVYEIN